MITMNVFDDDAFSAVQMTKYVDRVKYVPQYLSGLPGLYEPVPVRTTKVFIEEGGNEPVLIQTSPRGTPPKRRGNEKRKTKAFDTDRIAESSHMTADQLQGIRARGSETDLMAVAEEIARRQAILRRDVELTREYHLLNLVQGRFVDADGTLIYDWADEFNQPIPAEIDFDLDAANPESGAVKKKCNRVVRAMRKNLDGMGGNQVQIHALVGDDFYDALTQHDEVRKTFEAWSAAADLRNEHGRVYEAFRYGEITWHNYRGSDDNKVGILPKLAKFFPVNAGIFQMAYSPAETFDFVNTLGEEIYTWIVRDKDRNAWADVEMYSYPLPVCVQPKALHRARMT